MGTPSPPSPLGVELRWMRKVAGMTGQQIAGRLGVSQVAVSRWETGKRQPESESIDSWRDVCVVAVRQKLDSGGLEPPDRRQLNEALKRLTSRAHRLTLARLLEDASTEVLSTYVITRTGLAEFQEELRRLEQNSRQIRHWQPLFVPGQLQTPEYALAVMLGYEMDRTKADEAVAARMRRVERIMAGPRPRYHVIIAENALDVTFVDAPIGMRGGVLKRIHDAAELDHVTVQIMPRGQSYVMVPVGSFVVFDFGKDDSLVLADTYAAQVKFRSGRDVRRHDEVWQELTTLAMAPDASLEWLSQQIAE